MWDKTKLNGLWIDGYESLLKNVNRLVNLIKKQGQIFQKTTNRVLHEQQNFYLMHLLVLNEAKDIAFTVKVMYSEIII